MHYDSLTMPPLIPLMILFLATEHDSAQRWSVMRCMFLWACQCGVRLNDSSSVTGEQSFGGGGQPSEGEAVWSGEHHLETTEGSRASAAGQGEASKCWRSRVSFLKNNNWSMLVLSNSTVALIQMAQDCWIKRSTSPRSSRSTSSNAGYEFSCVCWWMFCPEWMVRSALSLCSFLGYYASSAIIHGAVNDTYNCEEWCAITFCSCDILLFCK